MRLHDAIHCDHALADHDFRLAASASEARDFDRLGQRDMVAMKSEGRHGKKRCVRNDE
jgi:hypothetical protein